MKRNLNAWEAIGEAKLKKHIHYDLSACELEKELMAARNLNEAYALISRWYCIGVEAGYRMRGKEIERQAARRA